MVPLTLLITFLLLIAFNIVYRLALRFCETEKRYIKMHRHTKLRPFSVLSTSLKIRHHHSFIHSNYFYSACSSPLPLRSAPDTARVLCRSFTPRRHRHLRVKDLPKVPTWRLERDSNPRPSGLKAATLPMHHHVLFQVEMSKLKWKAERQEKISNE